MSASLMASVVADGSIGVAGILHLLPSSGPWLQTQLAIALTVGILSFLSFCFLRTRSKVLYAPRTLLKGKRSLYSETRTRRRSS